MKTQLEVTYRNLEHSPAIDTLIQEKFDKLERLCNYISSGQIAVEKINDRPNSGSPYRVRIDLRVPPNHELVGEAHPEDEKQHVPLDAVVRNAFSKVERQLKELTQRQREFEQSKTHQASDSTAIVTKLFREDGYGFIKTLDDAEEVYFHQNSVSNDDFDRVEVGTAVRFLATEGDQGLQATTVHIVDKPGVRAGKSEQSLIEPPLGWQ